MRHATPCPSTAPTLHRRALSNCSTDIATSFFQGGQWDREIKAHTRPASSVVCGKRSSVILKSARDSAYTFSIHFPANWLQLRVLVPSRWGRHTRGGELARKQFEVRPLSSHFIAPPTVLLESLANEWFIEKLAQYLTGLCALVAK